MSPLLLLERVTAAAALLALVPWIVARLRATPTLPSERRTLGALVSGLLERRPAVHSAWERLRGWLAPLVPPSLADVGLAVGLCAVLVSGWVGIDLLEDVVTEDEIVDVDATVGRHVLARRSLVLVRVAEWISEASAPWGVVLLASFVGVALVRLRRRVEALGLLAAVAGAGLATTLLKVLVGRARPVGDALYQPLGDAFPSGHTSGTAALAVFLAWLLTRRAPWPAQLRAAALVAALTTVVAASRVYLSVHWLSDVLGGATLGVGWAVLCILWTRRRLIRPG